MSVNMDEYPDAKPPIIPNAPTYHPSDLESIVTLLELGALALTDAPGKLFTFDELLRSAREFGGGDGSIREADVRIVLPFMKIFRKKGKHYMLA